jgi:dolichyl-phosphate-mannose--protein O-mannosyl transferase/Gpi18-like mannosyltransferase
VRRGGWIAGALTGASWIGVSHAATSAEIERGSWFADVTAGFLLAALVAYALWVYLRPLWRSRDRGLGYALLFLTGLWAVKTVAVAFCPGFAIDVGTFEAWAFDIARDGPARMYHGGFFLDYPPGYLYALWGAGAFANWIHATGVLARIVIETPALASDFALAAVVFALVRKAGGSLTAWAAMLMVALNPALLFDTVGWGQTDSSLTLLLLLGVLMMAEARFELGCALTAVALLVKPQALMIMPILGFWTILRCDVRRWWRALLAFAAVIIVGVAPFQISQPWGWLPDLYRTTAAYYHETSVNAFNLIALLGGLRQSDAGTFAGISYFAIGMALLVPLYAFAGFTLQRNQTTRTLLFTTFIVLFGFFVFAPRMHERYLYPALVFAIPLVVDEPAMFLVFAVLSLTCLFNLAYVLHILGTTVFLEPRDTAAMAASVINVVTFFAAAALGYSVVRAKNAAESNDFGSEGERRWRSVLSGVSTRVRFSAPTAATFERFPWLRSDTIVVTVLMLAAAVLRFWHLGHPQEIVFDEVHFVGQARHYLHGEPFLDPHPPIAKLVIAAGIMLFGDKSSSWRLGNATIGTILVGVTYLLGRRMFRSRLAATLAAAFIALDGFFIVDSRIGCIDIVYLTLAAISYWLLFRFMQMPPGVQRRRTLIYLAIALGLCLGSKLYVPAVTFLIVVGFVFYTLLRPAIETDDARSSVRMRQAVGALLLVGSISSIFYIGSFAPHYYLGWWSGIEDLFQYYKGVLWYEKSVSTATHPYQSPWWSWPMMLRPVAYWQNFPPQGDVSTIWGAGNPVTWWAVIPAMTIMAVRATERPDLTRMFTVIAYLAYLVMWIPVSRILFLYHYMPSVYIGYLVLGGILADFWNGQTEFWESFAILITLFPALIVGLGHMAVVLRPAFIPAQWRSMAGLPMVVTLVLAYLVAFRFHHAYRFVTCVFLILATLTFIYFLPLWIGTPITRSGYYARMWIEGPGLRNWI